MKINDTEIFAESTENGIFVPIKPICIAIGVAYERQYTKIQEDEILSSVITLRVTTGADEKQYEIVCLPLMYIYGWLFTINPKNVAPEAKETVTRYRMECYQTLYRHFESLRNKTLLERETEAKLLEEEAHIEEEEKSLRTRKKEIDIELATLQQQRLNPNKSLFDSI
ncbi:MAG: hypothetical protein J1E16_05770 [Muribaculaceae bacterium]|nr:hypothetical protein [Muribaculaceae bacterium]